jgi:hypothetical protein
MRYFTYIAEQAFKTAPTGERLFYRGGPWSRPFIIPDVDTEQKLYRKHLWMLRVFLGGMLIGQPFLVILRPEVLDRSYWFLIYLASLVTLFWIVGRILFASDLKRLHRAPTRLRLHSFYSQMARRHSKTELLFDLIGSLLFVTGGVGILSIGANVAVGILAVSFFGLAAVAWGYALYLKSLTDELSNESDEGR